MIQLGYRVSRPSSWLRAVHSNTDICQRCPEHAQAQCLPYQCGDVLLLPVCSDNLTVDIPCLLERQTIDQRCMMRLHDRCQYLVMVVLSYDPAMDNKLYHANQGSLRWIIREHNTLSIPPVPVLVLDCNVALSQTLNYSWPLSMRWAA